MQGCHHRQEKKILGRADIDQIMGMRREFVLVGEHRLKIVFSGAPFDPDGAPAPTCGTPYVSDPKKRSSLAGE